MRTKLSCSAGRLRRRSATRSAAGPPCSGAGPVPRPISLVRNGNRTLSPMAVRSADCTANGPTWRWKNAATPSSRWRGPVSVISRRGVPVSSSPSMVEMSSSERVASQRSLPASQAHVDPPSETAGPRAHPDRWHRQGGPRVALRTRAPRATGVSMSVRHCRHGAPRLASRPSRISPLIVSARPRQ